MLPTTTLTLLLLALLSNLSLVSAASPTSFCKCTCFSNSTIIPLDAPRFLQHRRRDPVLHTPVNSEEAEKEGERRRRRRMLMRREEGGEDRKEFRAGNCNDCNRQYCMEAHLPICKDAGAEDVVATCFQRDSRKDEAVVFIFIFATAGLLGWAAVKPWMSKWIENARERRNYIPVSNQADT